MVQVALTLREVGYPYMVMPDHVPSHADDHASLQAFAYGYGYIKGFFRPSKPGGNVVVWPTMAGNPLPSAAVPETTVAIAGVVPNQIDPQGMH